MRGFIAVAPALRQDEIEALWTTADNMAELSMRGYFLVGDLDLHACETVNQLVDLMQSRGMAYHVQRFAHVGHEFPPSFDDYVEEALAFIDG